MRIQSRAFRLMIILIFIIPIISGRLRTVMFGGVFIISILFWLAMLKENGLKLKHINNDIEAYMILISTLILCYSSINIVFNEFSVDALERFFQLFLSISVLIATAKYKWRESDYSFIINIIRIIVLVSFLYWPLSGFKMNYYASIFSRGNAFGAELFCYLALYLMNLKKVKTIDKITIISIFFLMIIANSRSAILGVIVFLVLRYLFINFDKFRYKKLFIFMLLAICAIPMIYMFLYYSDFKDVLNEFSWKYFRKRFFSGRQYIWGELIEYIKQKPIIGYGLGITPEEMLGRNWSSHNWYIQSTLQMGIIGLGLILSIIGKIWNVLYEQRQHKACKTAGAFIIGVLAWQGFEVALTQNNFSVGIMIWFIWGLGLSFGIHDKRKAVV